MKPITTALWLASLLGSALGCSSADRSSDADLQSHQSEGTAGPRGALLPALDTAPPSETCADNPLLAGCNSSAAGGLATSNSATAPRAATAPSAPAPGDRYSAPGAN